MVNKRNEHKILIELKENSKFGAITNFIKVGSNVTFATLREQRTSAN
jgi:hypothetical protein